MQCKRQQFRSDGTWSELAVLAFAQEKAEKIGVQITS